MAGAIESTTQQSLEASGPAQGAKASGADLQVHHDEKDKQINLAHQELAGLLSNPQERTTLMARRGKPFHSSVLRVKRPRRA